MQRELRVGDQVKCISTSSHQDDCMWIYTEQVTKVGEVSTIEEVKISSMWKERGQIIKIKGIYTWLINQHFELYDEFRDAVRQANDEGSTTTP